MRKPIVVGALALALMAGTVAAQAQQKADKESQNFIKTAIQHNYAEIDVGKLAQEKGNSPEVKAFGAKLVQDHSDANQKAIAAAKQLGVDPPSGADTMHKAGYLKLKVLSGDTFDRTFAKDMVKDHDHDVKEFQKASQKPDAAGEFAKATLPTLQAHLQTAQSLAQKTTTGSGSKNK